MIPNWMTDGSVESWMDQRQIGDGAISGIQLIGGGTQNILIGFSRAGRRYVLRRSPANPNGDGNATNRREARILASLSKTDVPHPRFIDACDDEEVIGAAFFLMEGVEGFNAAQTMPRLHRENREIRHAMGLAMIDGALAIGNVDIDTAGLADLGSIEGFLERQPGRWWSMLDSYARYEGWPGIGALPGVNELQAWLEQDCPTHFTPGLMHGDYHLANVMFCNDGPQLAAIVDWELCTVGDPLLDLGWIMATWPSPDGQPTAQIVPEPWNGFPGISEMIDRYRSRSDRDTSTLTWYGVLACYKLGLIIEGTFARACAGKASAETGQLLHETCIRLLERALGWLERGSYESD